MTDLETLLRAHDPRETIKVVHTEDEGWIVLGFQTCICPTELKVAAVEWRESHGEWYQWLAQTMLRVRDLDLRPLTVRDLKGVVEGKLPPYEWMPCIPDAWAELTNGVDTWVGRRLAWDYPELFDSISRKRSECWGCGYPFRDIDDQDTWTAIIQKCDGDIPGRLKAAQEIVIDPDPGLAYQLQLLAERAKKDMNQNARKGKGLAYCAFCGTRGYVGKAGSGEVSIQFEHGIPKARWAEFFDCDFSSSEDKRTQDKNIWLACQACNNNKGTQTLGEFIRGTGRLLSRTENPDALRTVLSFEAALREARGLPPLAGWLLNALEQKEVVAA